VVKPSAARIHLEQKQQQHPLYRDDLAWLHSRHYADFVNRAGPQAIRMLRAAGIRRGVVCDAGCGGGQLSQRLLNAGYKVVAVDVSAAMIALARKRAPRATLICGSIAEVNLPACQAVLAIGEVFNYLGSARKITRAFRNVFRSLTPGGILIFDIKEPPARKLVRMSCRAGPDWALMAEIQEDPIRQKLIRIIDTFRKAGSCYRRQKEIHTLGVYPLTEIKRLLRSAGFTVRSLAGYGSCKLGPERKVLVARKPWVGEPQPS
jgi:SAM-dependent methyltransferase